MAFYGILLDKYKCVKSIIFYASKKPHFNARNYFLNMFMLMSNVLNLNINWYILILEVSICSFMARLFSATPDKLYEHLEVDSKQEQMSF